MAGILVVLMGLGFAAILFIVLVSIGALLLMGAVAFFLMWLYRKQKDKPRRTPLLVLSIIFAVLSVLLIVIPFSGALSEENLSYTDTGLVTEETYEEIRESDQFTINGERFTMAKVPFTRYDEHSPAVNIRDSNWMIYKVENDAGIDLYRFERHNYISTKGLIKAEDYYFNLTEPHEFTLKEGGSVYEPDFDIEKYNALYKLTLQNDHIEAERPDDSYKFSFYARSPDGVCERYIHIFYDKATGDVYYTPRYDSWDVYEIPDPEIENALRTMIENTID